jgi:hypothetical protein
VGLGWGWGWPYDYAGYSGCWSPVWTPYGWQWNSICDYYGGY